MSRLIALLMALKLMNQDFIFKSLCVLFLLLPTVVHAQLVEVRSVDFGEIAIVSNNSVQSIRMDYLGNINTDSSIRILRRGTPGLFRASGFAGNVQLFITSNILNSTMNPGVVSGEYPNLSTLNVPPSVFTRSDGTADIPVGGTVSTSGNGSLTFADAVYSSNIQITIDF
ncbi:hypothetical protein ACFO4O_06870 [Glaciecola siphonariae]|uniref:DUF4402 domain-containing protein n=1 Tax=Glaciecola siphonariae TaxID=521012 RepID=A0ABV9LTN7_9ALTE